MKRLFNHTKRNYKEMEKFDSNEYDWDVPEEYELHKPGDHDEDETDELDIVYSDEDDEYEEVVYTDEPDEPEENYEEEVEEEAYEEVVYAEGSEGYYEGENVAQDNYIEESEQYYAGEDAVYTDEESVYYEEPKEESYVAARTAKRVNNEKKNKGAFAYLWMKFTEMAVMDRIITVAGIAVLILALVTGSLYISSRLSAEEESLLASVGGQLEGIEVIGEKGLMAIADAEIAKLEAAEIVEEEQGETQEEPKDYDEEEYLNAVTVKLSMTSVKKDLKIKFINKDTGKLVSNVPFSVSITKPDGKSETWDDDDMDGIIYKKGIDGGNYKVLVNELAEEKYKNYTIPSSVQTVEVKKDIEYEKIDVSAEVKTEAEVDVSKEDTKVNETVVESALQDTVPWVESTSIPETYVEVPKATIPDPTTIAMNKAFLRMASLPEGLPPAVSGGDGQEIPGQKPTQTPTGNVAFTAAIESDDVNVAIGRTVSTKVISAGYTDGAALVYTVKSGDTNVATAEIDKDGNITVTGVAAGKATVTVTVDYAVGESFPVTQTLTVTVQEAPELVLDAATATVYLEVPVIIKATVTNAVWEGAITAESSNTAIATVDVIDREITITGVAVGDATITVKYTADGQELQAVCVVKVKEHPKTNTVDKLVDNKGNQLYVAENDKYREAVHADYYTADRFFIKGDVKYTGWQTIDGSVYYFTATGEKVTGEQIIQGAKYNFASDGSLITGSGTLGIDVSKWNGSIDWNAVKNSGVSYVIIRCGYRGSSQGSLIEDPMFNTNIKGAIAAGLKVGVYFFTQATDEIEAVEEASYVLDKIKNYRISYPVFLDVEPSGGRGDKIDKSTRTAVCKAFCETIQRAGYTAGIYANKTWLTEKIDASALSSYKIWLAQYAATPTYTGKYDMWQYKSTGKISGITGDVDMNLSYLGY